MRITLVTSTLAGGGAARVLAAMANHWADARHEVRLVSFEDGSVPPFYDLAGSVDVTYTDIWRASSGLISALANNVVRVRTLRRTILGGRPDAVIGFGDTVNVLVILALAGTGVPTVISERTDPACEDIGRVWSVLRRLTYPRAGMLVVQTPEAASFFRGWGVDVSVVPNPVLRPTAGEGAPILPSPCLVAMGRLDVEKNYPLMLNSFAEAVATRPGWSLCIAGEGPLVRETRDLASRLGIADNVIFAGQVADVGGLLCQAEGFVLSSVFEGYPNALCEAMASGLACISTDCPSGPRNILVHRENGLLVPNRDAAALSQAMGEIMDDQVLRQRLGAQAARLKDIQGADRIMTMWERCLNTVQGVMSEEQAG